MRHSPERLSPPIVGTVVAVPVQARGTSTAPRTWQIPCASPSRWSTKALRTSGTSLRQSQHPVASDASRGLSTMKSFQYSLRNFPSWNYLKQPPRCRSARSCQQPARLRWSEHVIPRHSGAADGNLLLKRTYQVPPDSARVQALTWPHVLSSRASHCCAGTVACSCRGGSRRRGTCALQS